MRVLVAGDFCPRGRLSSPIKSGDYEAVFAEVRKIISFADWSVVNFESPVASAEAIPIDKCGGHLRCHQNAVKAIKYAGFDCVTLANNHFLDYGEIGVKETLKTLDADDVEHVGGGMNLDEAAQILYKEINGQRLAVINCCEHEFSIATEHTAGSNPLNPINQYYAIQKARRYADRVLIIVHGGHEYFQLPSPRMIEVYRFFIDAGADAVVNHHQHCFSGYEVYKGKPIFYGIGNFCFDHPIHRNGKWTEGYMVMIDFSDDLPSFDLFPYQQCANSASVEMLDNNAFADQLNYLNYIIATPALLEEKVKAFYTSTSSQYMSIFEPFYNRFFMAAKNRGLIPSLIGKKRRLAAADYVGCESHRERLIWTLSPLGVAKKGNAKI